MTLTRKEILAMEPGYYLDALIAEKIMGWTKFGIREDGSHNGWNAPYGYSSSAMGYSQIISAAWEVVETLQISHMYTDIRTCADFYEVWITIPPFQEEVERTETVASPKLPEAICKAALLAVLNL